MAASETVEDFLLQPEVLLGPFDTFSAFQELFPSKYRKHPDVRLMYRAFQRHRHLLKKKVNEASSRRYNRTVQNVTTRTQLGDQCLEDAVEFLEDREVDAKEKLQEIHADITHIEKKIARLTKSVEENCAADIGPDDLNMEGIQKLHDALKNK